MSGRSVLGVAFLLTLPLVTPKIRGADEIEYFSYLRSLAFDRDVDFANEYRHFHDRDPQGLAGFRATFLERREPATGRPINFAPMGSALFWAPFFGLAHLGVIAARALGAEVAADGFSRPYVAAVCFASAAYAFAGLLLVHDLVRRATGASDRAATATSLALWFGTPLLYYVTVAPAFSHAVSFFAVTLLLWTWLRLRDRDPGLGTCALVGLVGGLAGLVREQDALFLAVPALDLAWRGLRTGGLAGAVPRVAVMAAASIAAFVPQMLAYRALNGTYGPSKLVARKMTWSSPHFLEVLFDPAHGLFLWTPLLLAAAFGLVAWVRTRHDSFAFGLVGALLLQAWINGSLESWTQAGAFGSRRFVSTTAVFACGLAVLFSGAERRGAPRPAAALLVLLAAWNLGLMVQFGLKLMDRQRLEWPKVATNQVLAVPRVLGRTAWLFFTDRERLVRESR